MIQQTENIATRIIFLAESNDAVGSLRSPTPTDVFTSTAAASIFP